MRRFLISSVICLSVIGYLHTQYAHAAIWVQGSSLTNELYNYCVWPIQQRHWTINFNGVGCGGSPKYNGVSFSAGHWRDGNSWQLTKSWMQSVSCLNSSDAIACNQYPQNSGCTANKFSAFCNN